MNQKQSRIAWITDTTCTLSEDFAAKNQLNIIPLQVVIDGKSYRESIDITDKQFYERMANESVTFQSSQPSIGEFVELYEKLKEEYDCGIAFHCSSKLSGTLATSVMAAEQVGFKLYAIDTLTGSYPHFYLLNKAMELFNQGKDVEEIVNQIEIMKTNTKLFLIPYNLDQLHKSGRVSGSARFIANLLNIKPILSVYDGASIKEKVRTEKRAINYMLDLLREDMKTSKISKVVVIHADNEEKALKLENDIKKEFKSIPTERMILVPVAGVHTGVGTIGISWVCE
ncbi:DegV family protein [Bacillus sp. AGMB 02131]|uniref:DegV family protein n=1 Tax=Peribacillus faecalis TaxID=2772559 RepID=A0A927H9E0_9BACI|nr:DegV family protein [Peribacillus faecalis]MBD3107495.1 DegV family protein [Peribacillus faecalis]